MDDNSQPPLLPAAYLAPVSAVGRRPERPYENGGRDRGRWYMCAV